MVGLWRWAWRDCAGVAGGSALLDTCGVCDDDPANDCAADCNGEFGGITWFNRRNKIV